MTATKHAPPFLLGSTAPADRAGSNAPPVYRFPTIRPGFRRLVQLASLPMLIFFMLPLAALLLRSSPNQWLASLSQPHIIQAVAISLGTTLLATLVSVLFGTPLAFALARDFLPFRRVFDTLIDLPTVLPPAVAGRPSAT